MKNADGRQDDKHVLLFSSQRILEHPDIQLSHGGFILVGLMSGGDYDTVRTGPFYHFCRSKTEIKLP
jgi:holliday junction resolvase YEN1